MTDFRIDTTTGDILLNDTRLQQGQSLTQVAAELVHLETRRRDMLTGYVWLDARPVSFARMPTAISFCFHHDRLEAFQWSVQLEGDLGNGTWPTREEIDAEIAFVRSALEQEFGDIPETGIMDCDWGRIGSVFDQKGFLALNFVKFEGQAV